MDDTPSYRYVNRELSWLAFNGRVLQEAGNPDVPVFERLNFLAIFSSNLDEFFRVRVASLRSLLRLRKKKTKKLDFDPAVLLRQIHAVVTVQQEAFGRVLREMILPELERCGIALIDERRLSQRQREALQPYFEETVAPLLRPLMIEREGEVPFLKNKGLYLVTELWERTDAISLSALEAHYALVEVPSPPLPRFVEVPGGGLLHKVLFLDDVIRLFLPVFYPANDVGASYAVKLSRDADLYLEDEFAGNLKEMIAKSLAKRETNVPTRFLYDLRMPHALLAFLKERLDLAEEDLVEGGRYHNLNDFFGFPRGDVQGRAYAPLPPLLHPELDGAASMRAAMAEKDRLLSFPYQKFDYVIRFLDEAAEDPAVEEIWMTLYRVSRDSAVARALLKAAERGKRVTAFVEIKARFDEQSNLDWAARMEAAGVAVLYSKPGIKVHTKLALVARREAGQLRHYAYLGTGNFNEKTARLYADHGLLTADPRLADEVRQIFAFLNGEVEKPVFEHLLMAPFYLRKAFYGLIDYEIEQARAGREAGMVLKMNSLEDRKIINRLYEASRAGVDIRMIVRGICCLAPGLPDQSETIHVTGILDRFLEHARVYAFHHGGEERIYLASADWMKRNLSRRVEVAFPLYDPDVRRDLRAVLDLQLADNTSARIIDAEQQNAYVQTDNGQQVRAQVDTYRYFKEQGKQEAVSFQIER